jgi:hypothetical protein
MDKIGAWAFVIGVILATIFGVLGGLTYGLAIVLVLIGLVVGLLNITDKEIKPFLMAGTVLVIVSSLGRDVLGIVSILGNVLDAMLVLFVPATVIVALKSVFSLARKK